MEKIKVCVKTNGKNEIVQIDSANFIDNIEDWIVVDEGEGDRYEHAYYQYLEKGLVDEQCRCNYKLVDGVVVEIAEADKPIIDPQPIEKSVWEELDEAYQEGVDSV